MLLKQSKYNFRAHPRAAWPAQSDGVFQNDRKERWMKGADTAGKVKQVLFAR